MTTIFFVIIGIVTAVLSILMNQPEPRTFWQFIKWSLYINLYIASILGIAECQIRKKNDAYYDSSDPNQFFGEIYHRLHGTAERKMIFFFVFISYILLMIMNISPWRK